MYNCFVFQINSDSIVIFQLHRAVKLIAENTDQPVYLYMSSYVGRYSFVMWNETTPNGIISICMLLYDSNCPNCFILHDLIFI